MDAGRECREAKSGSNRTTKLLSLKLNTISHHSNRWQKHRWCVGATKTSPFCKREKTKVFLINKSEFQRVLGFLLIAAFSVEDEENNNSFAERRKWRWKIYSQNIALHTRIEACCPPEKEQSEQHSYVSPIKLSTFDST